MYDYDRDLIDVFFHIDALHLYTIKQTDLCHPIQAIRALILHLCLTFNPI